MNSASLEMGIVFLFEDFLPGSYNESERIFFSKIVSTVINTDLSLYPKWLKCPHQFYKLIYKQCPNPVQCPNKPIDN